MNTVASGNTAPPQAGDAPDLEKTLALLIEETHRIWKFRHIAIVCAWLAAAAGWLAVHSLPDSYTASARVYVNAETVLKPLLQGLTVPTDAIEQVNLITRALRSRPHLETVAAKTGLASRARTPEQREKLLDSLHEEIRVEKAPNEQVYTISYQDYDPDMTRKVVQVLLDDFIANSLTEDVSQSADAQRFLEQQIKLYDQRLTESEDRLAAFKSKNMGLMPGSPGDFYTRFQAAQAAVEALQTQIRSLANRRNELASQLLGEQSGDGGAAVAASGRGSTSVDAPIAKMEADLAQLKQRFTDKHPSVVNLAQTLQDLYRIRDEERQQRAAGGPAAISTQNRDPVYQQLKMALGSADADLAGLRSQLQEKSAQVAYLRGMVNTIPEVEAQLNRLNRDYDVVKVEHETLLQRLERVKMNQEVHGDNQAVQFKVLDPPRTPLVPAAPNRVRFNSAVLVIAIGFGLFVAFVLAHRDPAFYSAAALREAAGLPVYGVISMAGSLAAGRKDRRFEIALSALVLAYMVTLILGSAAFSMPGFGVGSPTP